MGNDQAAHLLGTGNEKDSAGEDDGRDAVMPAALHGLGTSGWPPYNSANDNHVGHDHRSCRPLDGSYNNLACQDTGDGNKGAIA